MRFSDAFLEEIRQRLPITQVVGEHVVWDKRKSQPGRGDMWACCPFHGEKTPSFHADDRKGIYHCFGCGATGDHFRFLTEKTGVSFPEAVERLAGMAGVQMPARDEREEKREAARRSLYDIMELATAYFAAALEHNIGARARGYLNERGVSPNQQQRFRIGFAPDSRNGLKEHLAANGVSAEEMKATGLVAEREGDPLPYDRFRNRVMFPISDFRGRVIAFGGRALSPDVPAKYLNSPETELFHKRSVLYNGQGARRAAHDGATLIVVEGYLDVIAAVTAGFEGTVAPLGTALTEDHLQLIWRMTDIPVLCFRRRYGRPARGGTGGGSGFAGTGAGQVGQDRASARGPGPGRPDPRRRARRLPARARRRHAFERDGVRARDARPCARNPGSAGGARRTLARTRKQYSRRHGPAPLPAGLRRKAQRAVPSAMGQPAQRWAAGQLRRLWRARAGNRTLGRRFAACGRFGNAQKLPPAEAGAGGGCDATRGGDPDVPGQTTRICAKPGSKRWPSSISRRRRRAKCCGPCSISSPQAASRTANRFWRRSGKPGTARSSTACR